MYGDHGFDGEAAAWSLPDRITPALIEDAKRTLPAAEEAILPTSREVMVRWVSHLGLRCRSTPDAGQAKAQTASYVRGFELAEIPGLAFTEQTLERAAARFTFFPAYAELRDFLDGESKEATRRARRVRMIAEAKPTEREAKGRAWADLTPAEREAHDLRMASLRTKWPVAPKPLAEISKPTYVVKRND